MYIFWDHILYSTFYLNRFFVINPSIWKIYSGAGVLVQQVKPLLETLTSPIRVPVWVAATLLPTWLSVSAPAKAAGNAHRGWGPLPPTSQMGFSAPGPALAVTGIRGMNEQSQDTSSHSLPLLFNKKIKGKFIYFTLLFRFQVVFTIFSF